METGDGIETDLQAKDWLRQRAQRYRERVLNPSLRDKPLVWMKADAQSVEILLTELEKQGKLWEELQEQEKS